MTEDFVKENKERARAIFKALKGMTIDDARELLKGVDESIGCYARIDLDSEIERARKEKDAFENKIENSPCAVKD